MVILPKANKLVVAKILKIILTAIHYLAILLTTCPVNRTKEALIIAN